MIKGEIEFVDLEALQGAVGLRAIRAHFNYDLEDAEVDTIHLEQIMNTPNLSYSSRSSQFE